MRVAMFGGIGAALGAILDPLVKVPWLKEVGVYVGERPVWSSSLWLALTGAMIARFGLRRVLESANEDSAM